MINKIMLIGRVGKDATSKTFANGGSAVEFSLATSDKWKDKEGVWQEKTEWHNIKVTNKFIVERAEKLAKKGVLLYVEGKLTYRQYEKDGVKHYFPEILVETLRSLEKKEADGSGSTGSGNQAHTVDPDDDLPF